MMTTSQVISTVLASYEMAKVELRVDRLLQVVPLQLGPASQPLPKRCECLSFSCNRANPIRYEWAVKGYVPLRSPKSVYEDRESSARQSRPPMPLPDLCGAEAVSRSIFVNH